MLNIFIIIVTAARALILSLSIKEIKTVSAITRKYRKKKCLTIIKKKKQSFFLAHCVTFWTWQNCSYYTSRKTNILLTQQLESSNTKLTLNTYTRNRSSNSYKMCGECELLFSIFLHNNYYFLIKNKYVL